MAIYTCKTLILDSTGFYLIVRNVLWFSYCFAQFVLHFFSFLLSESTSSLLVLAVQINDITFYIVNLNDVFHVCLSSLSILPHQKENFEILKKRIGQFFVQKNSLEAFIRDVRPKLWKEAWKEWRRPLSLALALPQKRQTSFNLF